MIPRVVIHRARQQQHAGRAHQVFTERFDRLTDQARERDRASLGPAPHEPPGVAFKKLIQPVQITRDEAYVARDQCRAVTQRHLGQELAGRAVTDRRVILQRGHPGVQVRVARGDPTDAQPRQAIGLGGHAQRHGMWADVARRRQAVLGPVLRLAVYLVTKKDDPGLLRDLVDRLEGLGRHQIAGGVVRGIDHDRARVGTQVPSQRRDIQRPAVRFARLPQRHTATDAPRHLDQRLVTWPVHDNMVPGLERGVHKQENRLFGATVHQHLVRRDGAVQATDFAPQRGTARGFRIAQPVPLKTLGSPWLQRQHLANGQRLAVRTAQQMRYVKFIARKIALQLERQPAHRPHLRRIIIDHHTITIHPVTAGIAPAGHTHHSPPVPRTACGPQTACAPTKSPPSAPPG